MLIRNNPDIDFDRLSARIRARLDRYERGEHSPPPGFDLDARPQRTQSAFVASLPELLGLEDQELVEQAYLLLLRRPADPEGLAHCLGELRSGEDKGQVLAWISSSPEADRQGEPYRQLRGNRLKRSLVRLPLIGRLVLDLYTRVLAYPFRRHVNAHLNQIYRLIRDQRGALEGLTPERGELREALKALEGQIERQARERAEELVAQRRLAERLSQLAERSDRLAQQLGAQQEASERQLAERDRALQALKQDEVALTREVALLKLRLAQASEPSAPGHSAARDPAPVVRTDGGEGRAESLADEALYIALEAHFRGDPAAIEERLAYYLPLVQEHDAWRRATLSAVDIGCGRGEWLSLLSREGIGCLGIDLNRHNVQTCREKGLQILHEDALNWLRAQPADSVGLASSFHLIEHLDPERLFELLREIARVLVPGGLLILETPNAENLVTAAANFYMDPTHRRPLPPPLMEFLVDYQGFESIRLHRLNPVGEQYALHETTETARRCNQYFYGPQDYAITAIKPSAIEAASQSLE